MKKLFLFVLTLLFISTVGSAHAITASPSATKSPTPKTLPTDEEKNLNLNKQINDLKDRIASRVAQLKLVERRGVIGGVTQVTDTQITITDLQNNTRFIDVDELTKFSSPSAKDTFGISDITKGSRVGILGLYNKQSHRILARFVTVMTSPQTIHGVVYAKDSDSFTLKVITEKKEQYSVDIETITKTLSYTTADSSLTKSGFSKIGLGDRVIVVGYPDPKTKTKILASRIVYFPDAPKNPNITLPESAVAPQDTPVTSSGSGKKLTPITR